MSVKVDDNPVKEKVLSPILQMKKLRLREVSGFPMVTQLVHVEA